MLVIDGEETVANGLCFVVLTYPCFNGLIKELNPRKPRCEKLSLLASYCCIRPTTIERRCECWKHFRRIKGVRHMIRSSAFLGHVLRLQPPDIASLAKLEGTFQPLESRMKMLSVVRTVVCSQPRGWDMRTGAWFSRKDPMVAERTAGATRL